MTTALQLYPVFLKLEGKDVLVVGAGPVAEKKIVDLVHAGALVRVVALDPTDAVMQLAGEGKIELRARAFEPSDADGAWFVIAATADPEVQRSVSNAGAARRAFVIAVDDLPNGSAYSAAVVRRPPFTIAISSSGEAPALSRLVREVLEHVLPEEEWVEAARALRVRWRSDGTPMGARFGELLRSFRERLPVDP